MYMNIFLNRKNCDGGINGNRGSFRIDGMELRRLYHAGKSNRCAAVIM